MVTRLGKAKIEEPYNKQKEMIELIKTLLGLVEKNEENIDEVLEAFSPEQRKSLLQRLLKEQDKNS